MPKKTGNLKKCIFCGSSKGVTSDHIPPKSLFGKPRPSNLITVASCRKCNLEASKDDEYLKLTLALRIDTYDHLDVQKILPSVIRSLKKVGKQGYARAFIETMQRAELYTKSGLYVTETGFYTVEAERVDRVAKRITKGLFYHKKDYPLPLDCIVQPYSEYMISSLPEPLKKEIISKLLQPIMKVEPEVIGDRTFSYRYLFFDDNPYVSVWLFDFYGALHYLSTTFQEVT